MSDSTSHPSESTSYAGKTFRPQTPEEREEAIEIAFDYRGDITLSLSNGSLIEGYLFNRSTKANPPALQIFPKDQAGTVEVLYTDILSLSFTGEDTASGNSWEIWVSKKESQRKAEAERIEAEAKARGHL